MDWKWVLLLPHILSLFTTSGSEVVVQVNTKKWMYYVPERFLSITVDPLTLAAVGPLTQESYNMAKGLSPSFVRLGGLGTNALIFGKEFMKNGSTVSESQWDSVNDFAKGTGLDIIASLNPSVEVQGVWDSQNSLELISYSNKKQYNVVWQLGYDVRGYNASGAEIGRDLVRLASILDGFPKYAGSPVFSPDITSVSGAKQVHFVKDLLTSAGNSLGSLILQPKFSVEGEAEDCHEIMTSMISELDTYVWSKEGRLGKSPLKKPVWISESTPSKGTFSEAVQFVKRVGVAARLGVQVYLRQAGAASLKSQTPEFWFSLLYKNLVGQGVLDNKIVSQNQTGLNVFAHCTASVPEEKSVLDTDWNYEKGAVTLFGVNESPEAVKLTLRVTSKEEPLHIYVLTSDTENAPGKTPQTLLNGQELRLSPTWDLPVLSPRVKRPSKSSSVILPGNSIFFIVMPDSKIRTCSVPPLATPEFNLSEISKRLRLGTPRKSETLKEEEVIDPVEDLTNDGVYVTFTKKKRHDTESKNNNIRAEIIGKSLMETIISKLSPKKVEEKTTSRPEIKEAMPIYITFNEDSFLNKLAEGVKKELKEEDELEIEGSKDKYAPLTAAITHSKPEVTTETPTDESDKVDVIKIEPIIDNKPNYRIRRSSNEDPPPDSMGTDMEIIKKINDYKKTGTTADAGVERVARTLDQVSVSVAEPDVDPEQISEKNRNIRHIGGGAGGELDGGDGQSEVTKIPIGDPVAGKDDEEDVAKITSALIGVVRETEKVESVSESPGGLIVPPQISDSKLGEIMLEASKLTSEPEAGENSAPKEERSSTDLGTASPQLVVQPTNMGSPETTITPTLPASDQQLTPNTILLPSSVQTIPSGQNDPVVTIGDTPRGQVLSEPQIVNNQILLLQPRVIPVPPQIKSNHILRIPPPTPPNNDIINGGNTSPTVMIPVATINPDVSMNSEEKKENVVQNELLTVPTIVVPQDGGSQMVAISIPGNDTVVVTPSDVEMIGTDQENSSGVKTLENGSPLIEIANEDDKESVKVPRQIGAKTPKTLRLTVTPLSQTATLSTPVVQEVSPTPAGPVSPFKTPSKPLQANQVREPPKTPSAEELRERFKSLREKMLELRSQYIAAREKRLEEIKKQAIAKPPVPAAEADESLKSAIKRREAELKEWFKKFDKRETQPVDIIPLEDVKSRPRRLSLFTNDEGLDMAKFFDEEPTESYNYKRSPEISSPSRSQQVSSTLIPRTNPTGKHIFPLDTKTHGIIYNNKIYPAKLFSYLDRHDVDNSQITGVPREDQKVDEDPFKLENSMEIPGTKERIAFVPKDAFIKEMKSDFIPVIIIPPQDVEESKIDDLNSRDKRSTLGSLEDQFHQLKEDLLPKISSWIKNISENPPWKRDLERSSRTRRSLDDIRKTNDLRSLLIPIRTRSKEAKIQQIEDLVVDKVDKGEDEIYAAAKKYGGLVEKVGDQVLKEELNKIPEPEKSDEEGYCEEIGTSKQSVIRDPFKNSDSEGLESKTVETDGTTKGEDPDKITGEAKTTGKNSEATAGTSSTTFEESMFASVIADKIKDFFDAVRDWMGTPPTKA